MAAPDAPAISHPPLEEEPPAPPADEDVLAPEEDAPVGEPPPDATLPPIADPEGEIEELEDRSMPIERRLHDSKGMEKAYMQKGLKWFGKIELYGILGQAVKVVMDSDNLFNLNQIIDAVQDPRQMMAEVMGDAPPTEGQDNDGIEAARMMALFAQVVAISPQLLEQAYCVMLAIPKDWRNWAIKGAFPNMDDEMGQDILHTFIAQNWKVMEDFFTREAPKIIQRVTQERRKRSAGRR
jgi:hypothetical protein